MASIECKIDIPVGEGLVNGKLTVGREFYLNCHGDFPPSLDLGKLYFNLSESSKYALRILKFELRSPTEADLKVVSYKTGRMKFEHLQLMDGQNILDVVGALELDVESVLPQPSKTNSGEQAPSPQPFGPVGPVSMAVPNLYMALIATLIAFFICYLGYKILRRLQRRALLERLKKHDVAMLPVSEFYACIRKLQRTNTVFFGGQADPQDILAALVILETSFKKYLTRKYRVPAMEWSDRLILREIKKYHRPVFNRCGDLIRKLLHEFKMAERDKVRLTETDVLRISTQSQALVTELEKVES